MFTNLTKKFKNSKKDDDPKEVVSTVLLDKFTKIEQDRDEINKRKNFSFKFEAQQMEEEIVFWKGADVLSKRSFYLSIKDKIPANICLSLKCESELSDSERIIFSAHILQLLANISETTKKAQVHLNLNTAKSGYSGHVLVSKYKISSQKTQMEFSRIFNDTNINFKNVNEMLWFSFKCELKLHKKTAQILNEAIL